MTSAADDVRAAERRGLAFGLAGVVMFGLTLPMTRLAVAELDPLFVTAGRALLAAACAGAMLLAVGARVPLREEWPRYALFAVLVVLAFPLGMAIAMLHAPAAHGGVVLAVQPLLTALAAMIVAGERPSPAFWGCGIAGTAAVLTYALWSSAGSSALHWADLVLAVVAPCGSFGYALGGDLSRHRPGWQVISWALVLSAPVLVLILGVSGTPVNWGASAAAWGGFVYVGLFSMFLGFFAWNRGLVLGGIAKVGQTQLLQPFVTLTGAALLLGERIGVMEIGFLLLVLAIVALGSRMVVRR